MNTLVAGRECYVGTRVDKRSQFGGSEKGQAKQCSMDYVGSWGNNTILNSSKGFISVGKSRLCTL